uniref:Putative secreted protein n=1 Tax=Anopheles darlingi TaxID=43151 RepID=A0A2M4D918_ANODA
MRKKSQALCLLALTSGCYLQNIRSTYLQRRLGKALGKLCQVQMRSQVNQQTQLRRTRFLEASPAATNELGHQTTIICHLTDR